jgi:NADH-quinone oxidoreductase subunit N
MQTDDLILVAPEMALAVTAAVVLLVSVFRQGRSLILPACLVGIAVSVGLLINLALDLEAAGQHLEGFHRFLVFDHFAQYLKFLILGVLALVVMASWGYLDRVDSLRGEYYCILFISAVGMMLLPSTVELVTMYLALEIATLPIAALTAIFRTDRSTEAGIKFLLIAATSSAILLYGIVLIYGLIGSTEFDYIGQGISEYMYIGTGGGNAAIIVALVLVIVGFGFKISAVPFHMWVPDVYEGAPVPVTSFLSVASKTAGIAILLRVFYVIFGPLEIDWSAVFAGLSILSMILGNLVAVVQHNIKRMLAYSTIAHVGYILIGLASVPGRADALVDFTAIGSVLFYLAAYAFTNLAAFFVITTLSRKVDLEEISDYRGLARRNPYLAGIMALSMVSLTGIPPTAGFMAKLLIFSSAVASGLVWLVVIGVLTSVVAAYYYLRVIRVMYAESDEERDAVDTPMSMKLALALSVMGVVVLGVLPANAIERANDGAAALLGSMPF